MKQQKKKKKKKKKNKRDNGADVAEEMMKRLTKMLRMKTVMTLIIESAASDYDDAKKQLAKTRSRRMG